MLYHITVSLNAWTCLFFSVCALQNSWWHLYHMSTIMTHTFLRFLVDIQQFTTFSHHEGNHVWNVDQYPIIGYFCTLWRKFCLKFMKGHSELDIKFKQFIYHLKLLFYWLSHKQITDFGKHGVLVTLYISWHICYPDTTCENTTVQIGCF